MNALPPGPKSSRFVQGIEAYRHPLDFLERCARRYGDCFTIRIPGIPAPVTMVSDPEAIKEIYAADGTERLESGSIAAPMMELVIGEHSMLIIDGAKHRRHRGVMMPFFARGQFAKFGETILQLVDRELASWPIATPFPIRPRMQIITLQVILTVLFGAERISPVLAPDLVRQFFSGRPSPLMFLRWMQVDLGPLSPWGRFVRLRTEIYRSVKEEIARRAAGVAGDDVLAAMLDERDEDGQGLGEQEILDEVLTMILAGNDTTATSLAWAVYYILGHNEVLRELRGELDTTNGADRRTAERIAAAPYLDATVKEVLRIAPIFVFTLRRLTEPMRLAGYDLPAGALVAPCIYLVHRRADIWDEPERFNPKRFLDSRHPAHHFLPFGGGIRHCIGAALATYEMKLVLARMLTRTELKLAEGYVPHPRWIANFLGPSQDVPVVYTPRAESQPVPRVT